LRRSCTRAQLCVEQLEARAAVRLGAIHGRAGVAEHAVGGGPGVAGHRDAHRGADGDVLAPGRERTAEAVENPLSDGGGLVGPAELGVQQGELVAADACERVTAAHHLAEPGGDGP